MRYLRPIPKRLLPDDMLVFLPAEGGGRACSSARGRRCS